MNTSKAKKYYLSNKRRIIGQTRFTYFQLGKEFENESKLIEVQRVKQQKKYLNSMEENK